MDMVIYRVKLLVFEKTTLLAYFEPQNIEQGITNVEVRYSNIFEYLKDRAQQFHTSSFEIPCSTFYIQIDMI